MNMRDRKRAIENGNVPDRIPVQCVHPWDATIKRWEREGMPEGLSWNELNALLGLDGDLDTVLLPVNVGMAPLFEINILGRSNGRVTFRDEFGVTRRMLELDFEVTKGYMANSGSSGSMSEFLSFPLTDEASWEDLWGAHFSSDIINRVSYNWEQESVQYQKLAEEVYLLISGFPIMGAVGGLRQMMGFENFIYTMFDNPELIRRIWHELVDLWISLFEQVFATVPIDHIRFFEDMCSTQGPLISPAQYLDFFGEGYRRLLSFLRERGVRLLEFDSDGNAMLMLDAVTSLGFTMLHPTQASAGMEPEVILKNYPNLILSGGINLHLLSRNNKKEINSEVKQKYATAWKYGRYFPGPEHVIPASVSWDAIRVYADACLRYSVVAP